MNGKIVVIGGGNLNKSETLKIDRRIVELTGNKHPRALFIPTASGESQAYVDAFNNIYGKKLGCKTDTLYCLKRRPSTTSLRKQIMSADLIYVGGGNTLLMMNKWRSIGIDKMLIKAYRKGIVLSGLSAGGICWFKYGHSDSRSFSENPGWKYIRVSGIGLIDGIHCPHFNSATGRKKRKNSFKEFMKKYPDMGIGIDEHCAIEFVDGRYKLIPIRSGSHAYKIFKQNGKVNIEKIHIRKKYSKIEELYFR